MSGMAKKRHSLESGFGSETSFEDMESNSALRTYFKSYVPRLGSAIRMEDLTGDEFDDPTIDLNHVMGKGLAIRPPSPIRHSKHNQRNNGVQVAIQTDDVTMNSTYSVVSKKKDPSLEELQFITGEIEKKSYYSGKLADIMLSGLKGTLGRETYQVIVDGQLPINWIPLVRMNNDNTPYVEFLIKADVADQDPESQLSDYTMKHIVYSKYIVDYLVHSARRAGMAVNSSAPRSLQSRQQQKPACNIKQPVRPPSCSTPLSQRRINTSQSAKRNTSVVPKTKDNLNDSKRILPSRACRNVSVYKQQL